MPKPVPAGEPDDRYVIGVDFGTLSGRALVVRVSDGEELASASLDYPHAVMDTTLAATGAALPPDWALQVPADYVEVLKTAVPEAIRLAGIDPSQVIGIGTDFTASSPMPVIADGTPLNELPEYADRPHAYVKLWRHHAAQPQADRINELAAARQREVASPLRRTHLQRVGVRQGPAAARGGSRALRADGPLGRGGGLDRLAAHRPLCAQRLHRRIQGNPAGRRVSVRRVLGSAEPRVRTFRPRQGGARDRAARGIRRRSLRRSRRVDRPARGHRGVGRQRRCPRHRTRGASGRTGPDARDHGHLDLSRHERRPARRGARHVRGRRRRHRRQGSTATRPGSPGSATSSPGT